MQENVRRSSRKLANGQSIKSPVSRSQVVPVEEPMRRKYSAQANVNSVHTMAQQSSLNVTSAIPKQLKKAGANQGIQTIQVNFITLFEEIQHDLAGFNLLVGNVNQAIHNFFRLVVDPLCLQLTDNFNDRYVPASIFLQAVKVVVIKLCNSVLSLIQMDPDKGNSEFPSMNLSNANKACIIELTGLTNKEACQLFVELFYARLKTEAYYTRLA